MDTYLEIVWNGLRQHWLSALFLSFTASIILISLVIRWWWNRRWKRILEEQFDQENELDILPPLNPQDHEALALIKKFRREAWEISETELQLNVEVLTQRALRVVRSIAAIYHREVDTPEYEASLIESLQLVRRVTTRLIHLSRVTPIKFLGNQRLSDYQRYYKVYRKINENPILQRLKRYQYLHRAARWAMNIKNIANPFYWVGKELSREGYFFMLRWFYLIFITQVGREAVRLYGKRYFQKEEDRDMILVCHRLYILTQQWGGPSPKEWPILVSFVTDIPFLENDVKLHILSRWGRNRLPKKVEQQDFQTPSGTKWYRQGLKQLLKEACSHSPEKAQKIEEELCALKEVAPSEAQA